jgi:predicted RNase H-like HicB family nuclease
MTNYLVVYEHGDTSWGAYSPDVPGVFAVGETRSEVEKLMAEALPAHLDVLRDRGLPVPKPHNATGLVQVA